jgi:hypothetical protein
VSVYKKLLEDTRRIVKHQHEIAILKGETFNVFSILKMNHLENETHSAFLGELLNPKGSHYMGNVFLKLFLEKLGVEEHLNSETAKVILEHHVGSINYKSVTGGRIDIFIIANNGATISIENKIYAGDQELQIARYCNYNKTQNKVFYLTLNGDDPSKGSSGDKIIGEDFFTLSYRDDIIEWLEQCQKEATHLPILRETIKQYTILLKKLTGQLTDKKMEKEIKDLIINNYKAAHVIGRNIEKVELEAAKKFIVEVAERIQKELPDEFNVEASDDLTKPWTGIYIKNPSWHKSFVIKLEGASKVPWSNSVCGLHANKNIFDRNKIKTIFKEMQFYEDGFKETDSWVFFKPILNFSSSTGRARLFDEKEREDLVIEISNKLIELTLQCDQSLKELNKAE